MATAVLVLSLATTSDAQVAQSFEDLQQRGIIATGMKIIVRDSAGSETQGLLSELTADSLTLSRGDRRRTFNKSEVRRVRTGGGWATTAGVLIGIGAGLGISTAWSAVYGENEGGRFCRRCFAISSAVAVPAGAGIGAGIGAIIDRANRRTLYLAP